MSGCHSLTARTARGCQFSLEVDTNVYLFMKHLSVPGEIHVFRACYIDTLNTEDALRYSYFCSCLNYLKQQEIQQQLNDVRVFLFRNAQRFKVCYLRQWGLYFGV
jgi:hypothetical protein